MELVELQCNNEIKSKFHAEGVSLLDFYNKYLEYKRYPTLVNHAKKMASMFGSTYTCEQLFSSMKLAKSKLRTQLTDDHLQDVMILASSNLSPDLQKLSSTGVLKLGSKDPQGVRGQAPRVREQSFGFGFLKRWHWSFFL